MQRFVYQVSFALLLVLLLLSSASTSAPAADSPPATLPKVSFRQYLEAVEKHSLDLENQRQNINSAKAGISIAGVRPDPQLTFGVASKELSAANKPSASTATTLNLTKLLDTHFQIPIYTLTVLPSSTVTT